MPQPGAKANGPWVPQARAHGQQQVQVRLHAAQSRGPLLEGQELVASAGSTSEMLWGDERNGHQKVIRIGGRQQGNKSENEITLKVILGRPGSSHP